MKALVKLLGVGACLIYLANPSAGVFELIPDNLPIVGNLDEAAVTSALVLLLQSMRQKKSTVSAATGAPPRTPPLLPDQQR